MSLGGEPLLYLVDIAFEMRSYYAQCTSIQRREL